MALVWTRQRYFVGGKNRGGYAVFTSYTEPTRKTHGHLYGFVFGPYKTRKEAKGVMGYQS